MPHAAAARMATRDRDADRYRRVKPFFIRLLSNTTRPSPPIWRSGVGRCRVMCNASSRITSSAAAWNMAFYGYAASRLTSSAWLPSVANAAALPVFSYSIHYIAHAGFRDVIGNFCEEEAESVREYHQDTHAILPFKQEI